MSDSGFIDKNDNKIDDRVELQNAKTETRLNVDKWKNRRRMAWVALFSMLLVTYLAFFKVPIERLNVLKEVITWFYFVMGSIVGAYVGFATLDDINTRKPK